MSTSRLRVLRLRLPSNNQKVGASAPIIFPIIMSPNVERQTMNILATFLALCKGSYRSPRVLVSKSEELTPLVTTISRCNMLKHMENQFMFHWNFVRKHGSGEDVGYGFIRRPRQYCYHKGACDSILRYYAMLLDCTIGEARDRMQKQIEGATC